MAINMEEHRESTAQKTGPKEHCFWYQMHATQITQFLGWLLMFPPPLTSLVWAAVTEHHRLNSLETTESSFSLFWPGVQNQGIGGICVW